jgi:hypothetical protein
MLIMINKVGKMLEKQYKMSVNKNKIKNITH